MFIRVNPDSEDSQQKEPLVCTTYSNCEAGLAVYCEVQINQVPIIDCLWTQEAREH